MSDKWTDFEERLCCAICSGIAAAVSAEYRHMLKDVLASGTKNETFKKCVNEVLV